MPFASPCCPRWTACQLYVAEAEGLFDSLGVSVSLQTYGAAMDADTAFQRGQADAVACDAVKLTIWQNRGDSVQALFCSNLQLFLMTSHQARIKTTESIKDKIVAITRNSGVDFTADRILAHAKLKSDQLNRPQINDVALRAEMLCQQQYDGAILPEPFATRCEKQGATRIIGSSQLRQANPLMVLAVSGKAKAARKGELERVEQACQMAAERINSTPMAERARFLQMLPLERSDADQAVRIPNFELSPSVPDSLTSAVSAWAKSRKLLKK